VKAPNAFNKESRMKTMVIVALLIFSLGLTRVLAQDVSPPAPGPTNVIALRVAGSSVMDSGGEFSGNIESVALDPRAGQVLFAMISTAYPSNRLTVTPIPWQMLQYRSDGRTSVGIPGTYQQFQASVDRLTISRAPKVQSQERTNDFSWMAASYRYFQGSAVGGPGTASGTQTGGEASGNTTAATPEYPAADTSYVPAYYGGGGGFVSPLDDFVLWGTTLFGPDFVTNVFATNIAGTNLVLATNFVVSFTNFFATNTTSLSNRFAGTPFATNIFGTSGLPTNLLAANFTNLLAPNSFRTAAFGTNLAVLRSNFLAAFQTSPPALPDSQSFAPGFTNSVRMVPGTNKVPLSPPAVGAPPSGSGTFSPGAPAEQPTPPAQPVQPPPSAPVRPAPPVRPVR
jgi:hypothetical protein